MRVGKPFCQAVAIRHPQYLIFSLPGSRSHDPILNLRCGRAFFPNKYIPVSKWRETGTYGSYFTKNRPNFVYGKRLAQVLSGNCALLVVSLVATSWGARLIYGCADGRPFVRRHLLC